MQRLRPNPRAGFSLVEILIAVLLIGILLAVAAPRLLASRERAGDSAAQQQLQAVQQEANAYFTDQETFDGLDMDQLQNATGVEIIDNGGDVAEDGTSRQVSVEEEGHTLTLAARGGDNDQDGFNCWYLESSRGSGDRYGLDTVAFGGSCGAASAPDSDDDWDDFEFPSLADQD